MSTIWVLTAGQDGRWYFTEEADAVAAYEAAYAFWAQSHWTKHEYLDANGRTRRHGSACSWDGSFKISLIGHAANVPWEAP